MKLGRSKFRQWLPGPGLLFTAAFLIGSPAVLAADYYVATSGSDSSAGSMAAPFASIPKAYSMAKGGDTIYVRGGVYYPSAKIVLNKHATNAAPIRIFGYGNETPIIDGKNESERWRSLVEITGSYNHVKGLEVRNASNMGVSILGSGTGNILERLNVHHNGREWDEGSGIGIYENSSNNLILNCDSHHNYAALVKGNADGIRSSSRGAGNVLRGNRAWKNADDGYDMWNGAPTLLEHNYAFENGYDDNYNRLGDGNGFKLGGSHANLGYTSGGHTLRNNVAFRNPMHGFDENGANYPMVMHNNIAMSNGPDMPGGVSWSANYGLYKAGHILRNNISYGKLGEVNGDSRNNSWNLSVTVNSADFQSIDPSLALRARGADGSIPVSGFLRLLASSDLIDRGVNVGLPYTGSAPDLGAYEYAAAAPTPAPAPKPAPTPAPNPAPVTVALLNGGFESGLASWGVNWGNAKIVSNNVASGSKSLRVGLGEGGVAQVVKSIVPGKAYSLTAKGKIPNGSAQICEVGFKYRTSDGKDIAGALFKKKISAASWSAPALVVTGKAPANAKEVLVFIWRDAGRAQCFFDSLSFTAL